MDIQTTLADKQLKAKAKVEAVARLLLDRQIAIGELIRVAEGSKDKDKATCIEALEFATRARPEIASPACLDFVTRTPLSEAPRVRWESAKVVKNIAHRFPAKLAEAINNLLANSEHQGTVVRWSAAGALGAIVELGTKHNKDLVPAIEARLERGDEDQAIKKIYRAALKKVGQAGPTERSPARRRPRP